MGVTHEKSQARLGHLTRKQSELVRYLNQVLGKRFDGFAWASVQINVNAVSARRRDSNNTGPSIMFVLGEFNGGTFHSADPRCPDVSKNETIVFDGAQEHWSDEFTGGPRISLVFFNHSKVNMLDKADGDILRDLGF